MDAQIRIADGSTDDLPALYDWLREEDEFRGRVRVVTAPIGETELGSVPELLTVMLGAGGAGTALVASLTTWLKTRRTTAKITVVTAGRSVTLELETVDDVKPLLEEILRSGDAS
ncbi:effector-associated constant component EACC1 [Kribbella sp. NPDC054772]